LGVTESVAAGDGLGVAVADDRAGDTAASALASGLAVGDGRGVADAPNKVAETMPARISSVARAAIARGNT
jgi:hypothetical protein